MKNRVFLCLVAVLCTLVGATMAVADAVPEPVSRLLVPYFEVELGGGANPQSTLFSVVNTESSSRTVRVEVFSNQGVLVLDQNITIPGHGSYPVHLGLWLLSGRLPEGDLCNDPSDCPELLHLQEALSGRRSGKNGLYYGAPISSGNMVGFVIINDTSFSSDDVLIGDWFSVAPSDNSAQGERLVRYEAFNEACPDLCQRHGFRFLEGGGFDGGTHLIVFNWDSRHHSPQPTSFAPDYDGLVVGKAYDQQGGYLGDFSLDTIPTQVFAVADLGLPKDFGYLDITTSEESVIIVGYDALGKYSVMHQTWCLLFDICAFDPTAPGCTPPPCVPWRIAVTGPDSDLVCQAGGPCDLTLCASGSGSVRPLVDTPTLQGTGLVVENTSNRCIRVYTQNVSAGSNDPRFFGSGSCGDDEKILIITEEPPPPPAFLTLVKTVINDDGGTAVVSDFSLFIGGDSAVSGVEYELAPGTYTASENNLPGYTAGAWGGDCTPSGPNGVVTLQSGDHKKCTIANDDNPPVDHPAIAIEKATNGFDADNAPGPELTEGDHVVWTYVVTNTGDVTLTSVTVTDSRGVAVSCPKSTLVQGESMTCTGTGVAVLGQYANIGSVSGNPPSGPPVTDSDPSHYFAVAPPEPPVCTFFTGNGQSGTVTIPYGGNLALAWGSTGAETGYIFTLPPPDIGSVPANGTLTENNITTSREHKLRLDVPGGENNDCKLDVNIQPPPPPVCLSFTANPSTIIAGESTTLSWMTSGASAGAVNPGGIQATLPNGSTVVSPTEDTTFSLSLVNVAGASTSCNASVMVNPPPPSCECEGKVSQLTLRYLGNEGAQVKVKGRYGSDYHTLFDALVAANGTFTVNPYGGSVPSGFSGTLGTEIKIDVNGSYHTSIHTSCSQPIGPGLVSGAFVVVSGTSKSNGAPLCPVCNSSPSWSVTNGEVVASQHPQGGYHHVDVGYDWAVSGLTGSVHIYWVNGSSTRVKKELSFSKGCGQSLTGQSISWDSDAEAHHPAHGAHYFARVLAGDVVVYSEELPVTYE